MEVMEFPWAFSTEGCGLERVHHWPWPSWSHFGGRAHRAILPLFLWVLLPNLMVDIHNNHFFMVTKNLFHGSLSTNTQRCLLSCRAYTISASLMGKIHSSLLVLLLGCTATSFLVLLKDSSTSRLDRHNLLNSSWALTSALLGMFNLRILMLPKKFRLFFFHFQLNPLNDATHCQDFCDSPRFKQMGCFLLFSHGIFTWGAKPVPYAAVKCCPCFCCSALCLLLADTYYLGWGALQHLPRWCALPTLFRSLWQ